MAIEIAASCRCRVKRVATGDQIGFGELAELFVGFAATTIGAATTRR
jgi:hypothetical protein